MAAKGECSTALAARRGTIRSHSEAERRRRQRINAHLSTLRTLVPSASRMDKAALLGEVVRHVRELWGRADDATAGVGVGVVPLESDEAGVEEDHVDGAPTDDNDRRWQQQRRLIRAWVCCADRPGLLSDLGRAVRSISARPVRAEMATVGGRTRGVLELEISWDEADSDRAVALSTVRAAMRAVMLNREVLLTAGVGSTSRQGAIV